ncbi:MAG TPA: hypothetical protein PK557_02320 [Paludibacteraceae bacterium]|nr:hypothetical protein [Paludibacteraceae bacterium]HPW95789.1 hypothetical protein [Paludibacteraceae bacterium]
MPNHILTFRQNIKINVTFWQFLSIWKEFEWLKIIKQAQLPFLEYNLIEYFRFTLKN